MTPLFLNLEEVKTWLRIETDYTEEDDTLKMLMITAELYVKNAIDNFEEKIKNESFKLAASLICQMLIVTWYDNRDFSGGMQELPRKSVQSLLLQLQTTPIGG